MAPPPPDEGEDESIEMTARDRDRYLAEQGRGKAGHKDTLRRAAERFMEDVVDPAAARAAVQEATMSQAGGGRDDIAKSGTPRFTDSDLLLFEEGLRRRLREHLDLYAELSGRLLKRLVEGATPTDSFIQDVNEAHAWFDNGAEMIEAWNRILEEQGSRSQTP